MAEVLGEKPSFAGLWRIDYDKKFFFYPLKATNALLGLGLLNCVMMVGSYAKGPVVPD